MSPSCNSRASNCTNSASSVYSRFWNHSDLIWFKFGSHRDWPDLSGQPKTLYTCWGDTLGEPWLSVPSVNPTHKCSFEVVLRGSGGSLGKLLVGEWRLRCGSCLISVYGLIFNLFGSLNTKFEIGCFHWYQSIFSFLCFLFSAQSKYIN